MNKSLRHYLGLFLLGFVVGCLIVLGRAQAEAEQQKEKNSIKQSPRYLLESPGLVDTSLVPVSNTEDYKPLDFSWTSISAKSPTSGALPIIGPGSNKPYYEFSDGEGRSYPYYIVK